MKSFSFTFLGNINFGQGTTRYLNDILQQNQYESACIVIDHALKSVPIFIDILDSIKCNKTIVECDISEPTYEKLEEKRINSEKDKIDVFIGIGGGSALDMAKGLAVLYSNDNPAITYRGFDKFEEPILPIIAVPTTAGTGSEITPNASFIDTKEKRKMGINGEAIRPKYAILDPELTLSCPKAPTISAGVDSLVHATEAFVAKKSNPMARMFAKEGFKLVIENLPLLVADLENIELREKVMYGAFLSAIALMNSGTGPAAAMSYPLGVNFGVPHGIGGGIFLPYVIESNIEKGYYGYGELYSNKNSKIHSEKDKAIYYSNNLKSVWDKLDIPQNINQYGFTKDVIEKFASDTLELQNALDQNPVTFNKDNIYSTLNKLISD